MRRGRRALALACAVASALVPAQAAQARLGDLDPSFDGDGIATPDVGSATSARFGGIATRGDGRPVMAGWATIAGGIDEPVVAQLLSSGAPDDSFGVSGVRRIPAGGFTRRLHAVALDGDGRVLAAGDRRPSTAPAPGAPYVTRLTSAGAVDAGFADDLTNLAGEARAVIPLPDDRKILVAGWRQLAAAQRDVFFVARLNESGTLDPSFGIRDVDFGNSARAAAMARAPDGKIVLAGSVAGQPALARLNADGSPDTTFDGDGRLIGVGTNPDGSTLGDLRAVQVDGIGRITAAGGSGRYALVARRLADGAPGGATYGAVDETAGLNGLALDGARALVAGRAGPGRGPFQLLLGSLDGALAPEPAFAGAPPGWRSFPGAGEAFGAALGPGGTVYTAGGPAPFVSRHLPNAPPAAALDGPGQVLAGEPAAFDAGGSSDPEGEQLRYAFDLDGDGSYEFDGGTNPLALRSFADPGGYTVGVRVTDPRGASATAARPITVVAAPRPLPQPVLGKQGVAIPLRGVVRYRLPGTRKFVRMVELTAIPNGTEIDARRGRLLLTVLHDASGQLDGAKLYAGRFVFRQGDGATPITTLRLSGGSFRNCTVKAQASALAVISSVKGGTGTRTRRRVRKLWGDGRGRFRTRGRYGAATVRGTKWLTLDRCDGTKVRVVRGKVSVQDLVRPKRKPKLVRGGQQTFVPYKR